MKAWVGCRWGLVASALVLCCSCGTTGVARPDHVPEATAELPDKLTWLRDLPRPAPMSSPAAATRAAAAARTFMAARKYTAAVTSFEQAHTIAPDVLEYALGNGCALWAAGRYTAALSMLDTALTGAATGQRRISPSRLAEADVCRVNALLDLGGARNLGLAETLARHAAEKFPTIIDVHYALGRAQLAQGRPIAARESFFEIRSSARRHKGVNLGLLAALSPEPKSADYLAIAATVTKRWPEDPDALVIFGVVAEAAKRPSEAVAKYRQALNHRPDHPLANFNLARITEERQGLDAARPLYERYIKHASGAQRVRVQRLQRRLAKTPGT